MSAGGSALQDSHFRIQAGGQAHLELSHVTLRVPSAHISLINARACIDACACPHKGTGKGKFTSVGDRELELLGREYPQ